MKTYYFRFGTGDFVEYDIVSLPDDLSLDDVKKVIFRRYISDSVFNIMTTHQVTIFCGFVDIYDVFSPDDLNSRIMK